MLIKTADMKLPERVEPATCVLGLYSDGQKLFQLYRVTLQDMLRVRSKSGKDVAAFPNIFTIQQCGDCDLLMIWPKPDKPYEGRFRYCPAMKEI